MPMQAWRRSRWQPEIEPAVARRSRRCNARRLFSSGPDELFKHSRTTSLTMMYEGIRCGFGKPTDALKAAGARRTRFSVSAKHLTWKKGTLPKLEAEMIKRGNDLRGHRPVGGSRRHLPLPTALGEPMRLAGDRRAQKVAPATLSQGCRKVIKLA